MTSRWTREMVAGIGPDTARLPLLAAASSSAAFPSLELWDMWQVADRAGRTVVRDGRQWWFFLTAPRGGDPEGRHDVARIVLFSRGPDGWRDHGPAFPDGFAPGSREWSGSALLDDDGATLTMFFTATGDRHGGPHLRQRLFHATGQFQVGNGEARCDDWRPPIELVTADGDLYRAADQREPVDGSILGFRDPGYFHDPATGNDYVLFTGSSARTVDRFAGVIGLARREADGWSLLPPAIDATGVNIELERPHVVLRDGRYYLFWSTHRHRFAPDLSAPTGLYGMVAETTDGPWQPLNGTGLVAGNPDAAPSQCYCWWVTGEGEVASFVNYPGRDGPDAMTADERRARFGGTPAPFFRLAFDGPSVTVIP